MNASPPRDGLPLDAARTAIAAAISPITDIETVAVGAALGRVLAADVVAPTPVPPHDNAAMDGYAMRGFVDKSTISETAVLTKRIVGRALAGWPHAGMVGPDECVRILTGAKMPEGCDAVVPQEHAVVVDDRVTLLRAPRAGEHRRLAGEDLPAGTVVLPRGRRLTPADLGLVASTGAATIAVVRRARVAVFSTGRELRDIGQPLAAGQIHDSNRYTLVAMLTRLGVDAIDLGIVDDDPLALAAVFEQASSDAVMADVVVTSGGVSTGDADHTRDVVEGLGRVDFWNLAIKPGRPMAFGTLDGDGRRALLFGLPGNPVAVMVVFYALVRDALMALSGATPEPVTTIAARCGVGIAKAAGRTEFVRGIAREHDGAWQVATTGAQGSGILRSMSEANCLVVLDHDRGPVAAGDIVPIWPFHALV